MNPVLARPQMASGGRFPILTQISDELKFLVLLKVDVRTALAAGACCRRMRQFAHGNMFHVVALIVKGSVGDDAQKVKRLHDYALRIILKSTDPDLGEYFKKLASGLVRLCDFYFDRRCSFYFGQSYEPISLID
jgi:hypothetical protein